MTGNAAPVDTTVRAPRVCALAGITYKQLDYWCRSGLVQPSVAEAHGSGSWRYYSVLDVRIIRVVKALLDTGLTIGAVRSSLLVETLRGLDPAQWDGFLVLTRSGPEVTNDPARLIELLHKQTCMTLIVDLGPTAVTPADLEVATHA